MKIKLNNYDNYKFPSANRVKFISENDVLTKRPLNPGNSKIEIIKLINFLNESFYLPQDIDIEINIIFQYSALKDKIIDFFTMVDKM